MVFCFSLYPLIFILFHIVYPIIDLTSKICYRETSVGCIPVSLKDQQQVVSTGYNWRQHFSPTPFSQQRCLLSTSIKHSQMVIIATICQAVPSLEIQVQEKNFYSITQRQLDGPSTLDIIRVSVGILRTGEISFDSSIHLLTCTWLQGKNQWQTTKTFILLCRITQKFFLQTSSFTSMHF